MGCMGKNSMYLYHCILTYDFFHFFSCILMGYSMEELPHMPGMGGSDNLTSDDCKAKLTEVFRTKTRDEWGKNQLG